MSNGIWILKTCTSVPHIMLNFQVVTRSKLIFKYISSVFIWWLYLSHKHFVNHYLHSVLIHYQFSSVAQSCPTLCDPMNRSTPGLPVHHQLPEFTQTHVHRVRDAIQPSHPLSSPSPSAPNPSQHQSLLKRVNFSHEVSKVLELQL